MTNYTKVILIELESIAEQVRKKDTWSQAATKIKLLPYRILMSPENSKHCEELFESMTSDPTYSVREATSKFSYFYKKQVKKLKQQEDSAYLERLPKVQLGGNTAYIKIFKLYQSPSVYKGTLCFPWKMDQSVYNNTKYTKADIVKSFIEGQELFRKQSGYHPFGYLATIHVRGLVDEEIYAVSLKHPKDHWNTKTGLRFLYQAILKELKNYGYSHSLTKTVKREIAQKIGLID